MAQRDCFASKTLVPKCRSCPGDRVEYEMASKALSCTQKVIINTRVDERNPVNQLGKWWDTCYSFDICHTKVKTPILLDASGCYYVPACLHSFIVASCDVIAAHPIEGPETCQ